MTGSLSPTARTTLTRARHRGVPDRDALHALLADALLAHLGVVVEDHPVVLPMAFGVDPDGPDDGGSLYLHASVAAGWLSHAVDRDVCVTFTELDGLVLARSAFHHSVNFRSAVVIGRARLVTDPDERDLALGLVVDQIVPGRWATLRPHLRKELAATAVLAVPLREASLKERAGDPVDDDEDVEAGVWAGVLPLRRVCDGVISAADSHDQVPDDVRDRAAALAR